MVVEKGPVGLVVARGEAEIGVQQLCELTPVPGIDIVGPLPEPMQKLTHFSAGIPANARNPQGAAALMELLPLLDRHHARQLEQAASAGRVRPAISASGVAHDLALDDADQHAVLAARQRVDRRGAEARGEHAVGGARECRRAPRGRGA